MITVKPYGGLANRIRVIDSAFSLAYNLNHQLSIIWEKSFEINCGFFKLFSEYPGFIVCEKHANPLKKRILERFPEFLGKIKIKYPLKYDIVLVNKDIEHIKLSGNDFSFCKSAKNIYIQSFQPFYSENFFKWFKPADKIVEIVNSYTSNFSNNTIGIHIRRADNKLSIKHSPLESFIELMNYELEKESGTKFFLATDSIADEEELKKKFGKHIITNSKILDRNSEQGIIDALIDLCCLASTSKIIGSYYSSFSEVASQLNGIELKLVYIK